MPQNNNETIDISIIIKEIKKLWSSVDLSGFKNIKMFFIVSLVITAFLGKPAINGLKNSVGNVNVVVPGVGVEVPEPSLTNKTLVEGLTSIVTDEKDRIQLRDFYATLAHVVKTEPNLIKTTGNFREYNSLSGQLNFTGLDMKDKYDSLGGAIDNVLVGAIGKENASFTPEKRKTLVDVLNAISWSFNQ